MRRAFAILAGAGVLLAAMAPGFAYPSFAGPTGGPLTPNSDVAKGIEVAFNWQRLLLQGQQSYSDRVSSPVDGLQPAQFTSNGVDRADSLTGLLLWGNGRWEIGGFATSIDSIQPGGIFNGTGFGVNGKWQMTSQDRGDHFGSALGFVWANIDHLFEESGVAEEQVQWTTVYLALSKRLTGQIDGTVGVMQEHLTDTEHVFLTHGTHFVSETDEFNYFASLAIYSKDRRSSFWSEFRTELAGGAGLYSVAIRRELGGHWAGQIGWSNAKGPVPWSTDEGSWFAGLMYRVH